MQVIQNEDEVIVVDEGGNKFLQVNPGQEKYALGDLDETSNGTMIEVNDRAGEQNIKAYGTSFIVPKLAESSKADFMFQSGAVIFNETTKKFQGYDGTNWINF